MRILTPKDFFLLFLMCSAIVGIGGTYTFYRKYTTLQTDPQVMEQQKAAATIAAVGELMELPKEEQPTLATISDIEQLKGQPFFESAEPGDIILAYTVAMKAILYRPQTNKIINVAPLSMQQLRIAYLNGTTTSGASGSAERIVKEQYPHWQTIVVKDAAKKEYRITRVVDLSGQHGQEAYDLARLLKGEIGSLPPGEVAPEADLLVISGK